MIPISNWPESTARGAPKIMVMLLTPQTMQALFLSGYSSRRLPGVRSRSLAGCRAPPRCLVVHQPAFAFGQWSEGFLSGNGANDFVQIPFIGRFCRGFNPGQVHIVHHTAVFADVAVTGKHVIDRCFDHVLPHRLSIV